MGLAGAAFVLVWPIGREVNPPHLDGVAVAVVNLGGFLGRRSPRDRSAPCWMRVGGALVDGARRYPVEAYRAGFGVCAALAGAAALCLLMQETRGRNIYEEPPRRSAPGAGVTPEAFAAKIAEWGRGTMIGSHGTRFETAGQGRARAYLDFKPELTQLTGLFHAGAIIALADETATAAAMWETNPTGEFRPELFPLDPANVSELDQECESGHSRGRGGDRAPWTDDSGRRRTGLGRAPAADRRAHRNASGAGNPAATATADRTGPSGRDETACDSRQRSSWDSPWSSSCWPRSASSACGRRPPGVGEPGDRQRVTARPATHHGGARLAAVLARLRPASWSCAIGATRISGARAPPVPEPT